jgi:hypothetical protein
MTVSQDKWTGSKVKNLELNPIGTIITANKTRSHKGNIQVFLGGSIEKA